MKKFTIFVKFFCKKRLARRPGRRGTQALSGGRTDAGERLLKQFPASKQILCVFVANNFFLILKHETHQSESRLVL